MFLLGAPMKSSATNPVPLMTVAANNTFVFNPRTLRYQAINHKGQVVRSGRASGGAHYCRDVKRACRTPAGSYRIFSKRGADCRSSRYPLGRGGAKMPYCMFFSKLYAVHGHHDVPNRNASHGCIRVPVADARWLYHNFMRNGTRVVVKPY
ncbi:MAG: L,D-transpeptidase [Legionellaceae bacterium]|nr:L,D-transpeptidase [Legionellaceae bacterium]